VSERTIYRYWTKKASRGKGGAQWRLTGRPWRNGGGTAGGNTLFSLVWQGLTGYGKEKD